MSKINYEEEVKKVYPDAICKVVGIDNGHHAVKHFAIFKCDSFLRGDGIGYPTRKMRNVWRSAYDSIPKSTGAIANQA